MIGKSEILTEVMISNFIAKLPNYMQFCKWKCLYQMSQDGCSTITFFERLREYEQSILVIRDSKGWVFGCFCQEAWRVAF